MTRPSTGQQPSGGRAVLNDALAGAGMQGQAYMGLDLHPRPVVVTLAGELDMASAPLLTVLLDFALSACPGQVLVDIAGVTFIDSSGLKPLLEAQRVGRLQLRGTSPALELLMTARARARVRQQLLAVGA